MLYPSAHTKNSGQALLIVIISLAAIITVILSVVARSVTDIRSTTNQEEAVRAFSAAEAGVEKALINPGNGITISDSGELDNANYSANVTNFAQGTERFVHPKELISGDSATVWFVSHDASTGNLVCNSPTLPCFSGNRIRVCWGNQGASEAPAMEFSVLYDPTRDGNYSDLSVTRIAVDPNSSRRGSNFFLAPTSGSCNIDGTSFPYSTVVDFQTLGVPAGLVGANNGLQLGKIRLLYNTSLPQRVGVDTAASTAGNRILPGQGRRIESTGQSGESTRKVEVFTLYSEVPSVFDSVIFSPNGITK